MGQATVDRTFVLDRPFDDIQMSAMCGVVASVCPPWEPDATCPHDMAKVAMECEHGADPCIFRRDGHPAGEEPFDDFNLACTGRAGADVPRVETVGLVEPFEDMEVSIGRGDLCRVSVHGVLWSENPFEDMEMTVL